jgi:signal transduction histidine kinase/DNA-binding response OmpR family regulator
LLKNYRAENNALLFGYVIFIMDKLHAKAWFSSTEHISFTEKIILKYNQNSIAFDFVALNFTTPGKNQYQYKLEGFDEDWIQTEEKSTANYTNLNPGRYVFRVKASNNSHVWNEKGISVQIRILPPPWMKWWAFVLYALMALATLYFFRKYSLIRAKIKNDLVINNIKNEQKNVIQQMKLRFFANISHEFRTPLTLIIGPLEELLSDKQLKPMVKQNYHFMYQNAHRLLNLINQLLDIFKIESGKMNIILRKDDMVLYSRKIASAFDSLARQNNIHFQFISNHSTSIGWFDKDKVEKILFNLLSNAFKFTPQSGEIILKVITELDSVSNEAKWVTFYIQDNGPGIPEDKKEFLFQRFVQLDNQKQSKGTGTGLGLSLVNDLVKILHGEISFVGNEGKGTTFIVRLPLEKNAFENDNPSIETNESELTRYQSNGLMQAQDIDTEDYIEITGPLKKPARKLLIVEDNHDIRAYIRLHFFDSFQVIEAENGASGFEIALHNQPDLIVSDVLMPVMDGMDLCKKIKEDERTSHIPVIILTALSEEMDTINALKLGADDYITKPFNVEALKLKVSNVLSSREKLRLKFANQVWLEPKDITVTTADEKFLKKSMEIVEVNMDNPEFDVDYFVKEIGMSRSQLYRKMEMLTNQSVKEFVRTIRLKRAAQLLEKDNFTISEILAQIGINNRSYFAKCFKDLFGVNPSDYKKKQSINN